MFPLASPDRPRMAGGRAPLRLAAQASLRHRVSATSVAQRGRAGAGPAPGCRPLLPAGHRARCRRCGYARRLRHRAGRGGARHRAYRRPVGHTGRAQPRGAAASRAATAGRTDHRHGIRAPLRASTRHVRYATCTAACAAVTRNGARPVNSQACVLMPRLSRFNCWLRLSNARATCRPASSTRGST